jgi:hypothetical protein
MERPAASRAAAHTRICTLSLCTAALMPPATCLLLRRWIKVRSCQHLAQLCLLHLQRLAQHFDALFKQQALETCISTKHVAGAAFTLAGTAINAILCSDSGFTAHCNSQHSTLTDAACGRSGTGAAPVFCATSCMLASKRSYNSSRSFCTAADCCASTSASHSRFFTYDVTQQHICTCMVRTGRSHQCSSDRTAALPQRLCMRAGVEWWCTPASLPLQVVPLLVPGLPCPCLR